MIFARKKVKKKIKRPYGYVLHSLFVYNNNNKLLIYINSIDSKNYEIYLQKRKSGTGSRLR